MKANDACKMVLQLADAKQAMYDYVQSRMYLLAPNLTQVCGASAAAKLLGEACMLPFASFSSNLTPHIMAFPHTHRYCWRTHCAL